MTNPLTAVFGATIDLGSCIVGRNLNLVVVRGFARLDELAAISAPDVYDYYANPHGTQRELDQKHAKSCFEYASGSANVLAQDDPRSFPEIILNARDRQVVEFYHTESPEHALDIDAFSTDDDIPTGCIGLRIRLSDIDFPHPTKNPQISRVDGNHRLSGVDVFALSDSEADSDDSSPIVAFSLFVGMNADQEIKLFKDINGEHKGMNVTHLATAEVRIHGESLKFDESRWHIWMADALTRPGRSFEGMIFFGGQKAGAKEVLGKVPPVRLNTLAGTLKLQLARADVARSTYLGQPDLLLELVDRYWQAVRSVFPAEWEDKKNFILLQTIGLSGFAQLGATLLDQALTDGKVSKEDFELYLQAVHQEVNLARDAWAGIAGAGGAKQVAEALIKAATRNNATKIRIEQELLGGRPDVAAELD